jgi:hypothetical protein
LHYETVNLGGLVKGTRYIEIDAQAGQCSVVNGEVLSGIFGRLIALGMKHRIRQGLEGMNAALKRFAEENMSNGA